MQLMKLEALGLGFACYRQGKGEIIVEGILQRPLDTKNKYRICSKSEHPSMETE